jgi:FtsP/CotA-like multicopper oxidase with cupredoxin domain
MMKDKTRTRLPEVIIMGLIALVIMISPAFGATYNLRAGTMDMPDPANPGVDTILMWGYALVSYDLEDGLGLIAVNGDVTVPGPPLTVPAGQGLTVNLTNDLPVPVSIIIPGQIGDSPQVVRNLDGRVVSFTHETPAAGGPVSYNWSSIEPGTYLYHSGTHPAVQVQMGLYGAMTNDALDGAYPGIGYDAEALIIYSEIDPALHAAVDGGTYGTPAYPSTIDYNPKYFLVNGIAGDAGPVVTAAPGNSVLIRLLNAGLKDHAPEILGSHVSVIAEDGKLYPYPREQYSMLLAAGKTLDALLLSPAEGDYPIFDRRLYRSNVGSVQGPMYTYISVTP